LPAEDVLRLGEVTEQVEVPKALKLTEEGTAPVVAAVACCDDIRP